MPLTNFRWLSHGDTTITCGMKKMSLSTFRLTLDFKFDLIFVICLQLTRSFELTLNPLINQ